METQKPVVMKAPTADQSKQALELLRSANKVQPINKALDMLSAELERMHSTYRVCVAQNFKKDDWHSILIGLQSKFTDCVHKLLDSNKEPQ